MRKLGSEELKQCYLTSKKNKARSLVFLTFFEVCGVQYTTLMQYILALEISAFKNRLIGLSAIVLPLKDKIIYRSPDG